jgi:hypothetical protein
VDFTKLINNLNLEGTEMSRVLGGKGNRDILANFYSNNAEKFQLIAVYLLYSFISKNSFTKEEWTAYQTAIMDFGKLLDKCAYEKETEAQKTEIA